MIVLGAGIGCRGRPEGRQLLEPGSNLLLERPSSNTFTICSCLWGLVTGAVAAGLLALRRVLPAVVAFVVLEVSGAKSRAS